MKPKQKTKKTAVNFRVETLNDMARKTQNRPHVPVSVNKVRNYASKYYKVCQRTSGPSKFFLHVFSSVRHLFYILVWFNRKTACEPFMNELDSVPVETSGRNALSKFSNRHCNDIHVLNSGLRAPIPRFTIVLGPKTPAESLRS